MKKFEYKQVNSQMTNMEMNKLGAEGWEFVSHTACTYPSGQLIQCYFFKRELL